MLKIPMCINKMSIVFFISALPYVGSLYITDNIYVKKFFLFGKIIVLVILFANILLKKKRNISSATLLIILMQLYLLIVTYFRQADIRRCLSTILPILGVVLLYEIGFEYPREFIKSQYCLFYIVIVLNFISELFFPNGIYYAELTGYTQYWILGYYNNHTLGYIPAICFSLLYKRIYGKKWGPDILLFIVVISALLVKSGGVVFTLGVMLVFLYVLRRCKWIINFYLAWSIHIFFFIFILVTKNRKIIGIITIFTNYLFNKTQSFIARYYLWEDALGYIKQKLMWGHGIESQIARLSEYGWGLHTHNFVLEILHQGGIVYACFFVGLIVIVGRKFNKCHNILLKGSILIPILGWIADTLMEPFMTAFLLALLIIAYHVNVIEEIVKHQCIGIALINKN